MSPEPSTPPSWGEQLRDEPGRAVVDLVGGILSAALAYVALAVATLSWCVPDSCERSVAGIVGGSVTIALATTGAVRWLSLRLLTWQRAAVIGGTVAVVLLVYEAIDKLVL